ncbi:MAG: hypothetical protein JGK28_03755 [Microcoleus sp. PH2017_07_MST_O_A]|nr:hypothetical protein [Microcoleus sp. PH2017_07_MST_O_A]
MFKYKDCNCRTTTLKDAEVPGVGICAKFSIALWDKLRVLMRSPAVDKSLKNLCISR